MRKRPLLILSGPTGIGKTNLSIALAKELSGEIISADSMQVYKGMDIGSAKIRPEEMDGVVHHLIDVLPPTAPFDITIFQSMAKEAMQGIYDRGHLPMIVGGTGFYIQSVIYDIDFTSEESDPTYRTMLEEIAKTEGGAALHKILEEIDPPSATAIHENNIKRQIRAIEYHHLTGRRISEHNKEERQKASPYDFHYFVLTDSMEKVYERIERRVDQMMKDGLVEEVERLRAAGIKREDTSMQGLGYKEILSFLEGDISLERAVYLIKRDTRHFAKRQMTWFRRERDVIFLDRNDFSDDNAIVRHIKEYMSNDSIGGKDHVTISS